MKQARQRYSLTILTVIAESEINRFLQFQGLKFFYLESFSLSKFFIIFRLERKFRRVWHGFCREMILTITGTITLTGTGTDLRGWI